MKNSFITTFLAKSKTLIPKIRIEVRKDALGKEDNTTEREPTRLSGGKRSDVNGKKMTPQRAKEEKLTTRAVFD